MASTSKQVTRLADPEILRSWSQKSTVSSCAIGGITAANLAPLVRAGANLLDIIGGVWIHPGRAGRCRARDQRRHQGRSGLNRPSIRSCFL